MVNFCAVFGCSNRSSRERSKSFYRLPSIVEHQGPETHMLSEKRRTLWLSRLRRADLKESQYSNVRICSDHFVKGKPSSLYEQDDPDWAPSLRLGHSSVKDGTSAEDRHSRSLERNRKKKVLEKQEAECMAFRKHCPKCTVIIDCFEVFIERPSNLLARAQTYSSYKHHNTAKYLIGVTPQGTVCFISSGWGGRASDKHVTESSRLLSFLLPGDTILADRGFDIADSVGLCMATIKMPAFTKGKAQLRGIEVEQTRRIANVRIHVERVIGNLRQKYSLLQETQPIHFLIAPTDGEPPLLDKITTVCCALVNMSNSVVPFD